jgi:DNA polymerase elongation subunit (family B)
MVKLFLNSLYGKFGQKMDKWKATSIDDIQMIDPSFDFDGWIMDEYKIPKIMIGGMDVTPKIRYIGEQLQMSGEEEESQISFPAIAAHVTSYARLILWNVIRWCRDHNVKYYYCDTDSIFVQGEIDPSFVDANILGKLKVEKYYENGVEFINLKNYCALTPDHKKVVENEDGEKITIDEETFLKETKVFKGGSWKMKGVSNNAELIDENTFIQQEWGGLPKQEYYKKFGRRSGEFWIIYKEKHNHGNINKGILSENGDINPFIKCEF